MSQAYLKIENPGVAPEESFTLLGASTKRRGDNGAIIGTYGSGSKNGVAVCLRNNLPPTVFAGNLKLEFGTRKQGVNDGLQDHSFNRVFVKYGGKDKDGKNRSSTEDLGFVLEYGANDWLSIDLALREFVSNALDRAVEEDEVLFIQEYGRKVGPDVVSLINQKEGAAYDDFKQAVFDYRRVATGFEKVQVKVVDESQVRAKSGTTRVFIPLTDEVLSFYNNLGKWFLHFSEPHLLKHTILPKANRNLGRRQAAVIYRRGVRVREFEQSDIPSLYDYNLENLRLDEARKVDDWYVQYEAARALAGADEDTIARLWQSFLDRSEYWEHSFNLYGLEQGVQNEKQKETWVKAFERVVGDYGVVTTKASKEVAARKGFTVIEAPEAFVQAAEKHGVRTPSKVLSIDELEGREILDPTEDTLAALDFCWDLIERHGMANGREKPQAKTFRKIMNAEAQILGYYKNDTVFIHQDITTGDPESLSQQLLVTMLEECVHHCTGSGDLSRDFQDACLNLAVYAAREAASLLA